MNRWRIVYQETVAADAEIVVQARGPVADELLALLESYAKRQRGRLAQGTPTRSAETTGSAGEADGGPVLAEDAPTPSPEEPS